MRKNIIISAALGVAAVTGLAGCGTTAVVVQTEATTEATATVAQSAKAQTTANEGSLSKTDTQTTEATTAAITETTTQIQSVSEETTNKLYDEIIKIYYVIQQRCDGILYNIPDDVLQLFPKGGLWDYFRESVSSMGTDYYYTIHDLDNNGIKELVIFNGDSPNAIYTIYGGEVTPLAFGAYRHMLKINDDGEVYSWNHGGHYDYQISKYKFSEDGKSLIYEYYKGVESNYAKDELSYYSVMSVDGIDFFDVITGDKIKITETEFRETEDEFDSVECTFEKIPVKAYENKQEESVSQTEGIIKSNVTEILNMNYGQFKALYGDIAENTTADYFVASIEDYYITFFGDIKQNSDGEFIGYELTDSVKVGAVSGKLNKLLQLDFGQTGLNIDDVQKKLSNNKKVSELKVIYPRGLVYASYDFNNGGYDSSDYNLRIEISDENDVISSEKTATIFNYEFKER